MRRFIAFIVLVVSMLGMVLFNVQATEDKVNWSQEFDRGTEVVYHIEQSEENSDKKVEIDEIIETIGLRLEEAGATSYNIDYAVDQERYEVKITLGTRYASEIDNILRSTTSAGRINLFTTNGDGIENSVEDIVRGSAIVDWDGNNQPIIQVEVSSEVNSLADTASENGDNLLVLWQGKYDALDYKELVENENLVVENPDLSEKGKTIDQLKSKVLAVINLSDTSSTDENGNQTYDNSTLKKGIDDQEGKYFLRFDAFGYSENAESTTKFNAQSARSFERLLNANEDLLDYEITEVYRRTVNANYGANASELMLISTIVAVVIIGIYLLLTYGLSAISGIVGIGITTILEFMLLNFFAIQVGPASILALLCSLTMSTSMLCSYYNKTKDEVYNGRVLSKASNDGFRKTISTAVDSTILLFGLGIILALISNESIISFAIFLFISALLNVLFVFLLSKGLNNYLYNSHIANKNKLFALNDDYVADFNGDRQKEIPSSLPEKIDVKKHGKKSFIAIVAGIVVSVGAMVGFGIADTTFNYSNENEFGRIEIRTGYNELFEQDEEYQLTTENTAEVNFKYFLEGLSDDIEVTNVWVVPNQKNPYETSEEKYLTYFYADLSTYLEFDSEAFDVLEKYVVEKDSKYSMVTTYTVYPGVVRGDFTNTILLVGITVAATLVYFLIRYRYSFALSATTSLLAGGVISYGLLALTRLTASIYVGAGVLAGSLITMLLFIPFGNRINQLKNESKVKVTVYSQREEIALRAQKENASTFVKTVLGLAVLLLVLIPLSPANMITIYVGALISLLVNGVIGFFTLIPLHLFLEKHLKFNKFRERKAQIEKEKREKLAKLNRNKGAEPEEIIIPGIND